MTARQSVIYYFYIHGALRDSWLVLETLNQLTKGVLSDRRIVTAWWVVKEQRITNGGSLDGVR